MLSTDVLIARSEADQETLFSGIIALIIFSLHLYAMFGLFYGIYFISRALSIAEDKGSKVDDYIGYFFLLWFFPIGIWFIQPKINILHKSQATNYT